MLLVARPARLPFPAMLCNVLVAKAAEAQFLLMFLITLVLQIPTFNTGRETTSLQTET